MSDTEERAHAILGASSSKGWLACTMRAAVEKDLPEEDSTFSREGTYGHKLFEAQLLCYLSGNDGPDVDYCQALTDRETDEEAAEFYTPELQRNVTTAVDRVIERVEALREQHGADQVHVFLERRLHFEQWVPEGFGTGDVMIAYPGGLDVLDLKMGGGVYVEGKGNSQMRLYALGGWALLNLLFDIVKIRTEILQPRMNNFSSEELNVHGFGGLLDWAENVVKPRAAIAWAAYNGDYSQARFAPGKHCSETFCKARFTCSARARYLLEIAEMPYMGEEPHTLTVDQLESVIGKADMAAKWAKDVQAYLLRQAETGKVQLKQYKLVEGRSFREVTDTRAAAEILMRNGYSAARVYKEPELANLGDLERLVGAKKLTELLGDLLHKPTGKLTLHPIDDSKAAAVLKKPGSTKDFDDIDD